MTLTQTRTSRPRIRTSWWVMLGVLLLAVSVLGAGKGLQSTGDSAADPGRSSTLRAGGFGHVDIENGVANMYTSVPGVVDEVMARDGQDVDKDAPLFRVDDTQAKIDVSRALEATELAELKFRMACAEIDKQQALLTAQQAVVAAKQHVVKSIEAKAKEAERWSNAGQVSKETAEQAREAVKAAEKEVEAEQAKTRALQTGINQANIAMLQAQTGMDDAHQVVRKAKYGLDKCTVRAPSKGKVLRMFVAVGDMLGPTPRQPAVQFAAFDGDGHLRLIVRAEIDQEFAAGVHAPQDAEIADDVQTNQPWTGRVRRVSDWYTHRRSMLQEPGQFNDVRTLEVIIDLDNPPEGLKIGQRVRVTLK